MNGNSCATGFGISRHTRHATVIVQLLNALLCCRISVDLVISYTLSLLDNHDFRIILKDDVAIIERGATGPLAGTQYPTSPDSYGESR